MDSFEASTAVPQRNENCLQKNCRCRSSNWNSLSNALVAPLAPRTLFPGLSLSVLLFYGTAFAQEAQPERVQAALETGGLVWPPYVVGNLSIDVFNDYTFKADDPDAEINDAFAEVRLGLFVFLSRYLYVETGFLLESVSQPNDGSDHFFEDHALKWGALALTYERDNFWVSAGKGPVNFGIAESVAAGIYGADIASDFYSIKGRIGVGGNYTFDFGDAGNHAVRAAVFTLDTSFLSDFYFSSTDGPDRERGGAGNTRDLKNWAVSVDGGNFSWAPGVRYHLSYVSQKTDFIRGSNGEILPSSLVEDERRYAAAVALNPIELGRGVSVAPLFEYARLENARGIGDRRESYLTGSLDFQYKQWNVALAATGWEVDAPGESSVSNLQSQISGGYTFENGVTIDVGYRYLDEEDEISHTIGLALNYEIPFAF